MDAPFPTALYEKTAGPLSRNPTLDLILDLLHRALENGEVDRQWVRQDPDWEDFHADERWIILTES